MTNKRREAKDYAVEKTVDTTKILEALEVTKFEPVTIEEIIERIGVIPGRKAGKEKLKPDAVRSILITLELTGWAAKSGKKWTIGKKLIRFAGSISRHTF